MIEWILTAILLVGYYITWPIWAIIAFLRKQTFDEMWHNDYWGRKALCFLVGLCVTVPAAITGVIYLVTHLKLGWE